MVLITPKKDLHLIQLLRGIASMLVVLLHLTINFKSVSGTQFLGGFFSFGGSGVDIFFVLSGFIITYSSWQHIGKAATVTTFLKKRFIRVFPIYWLIITLFLILQMVLPEFYETHFDFSSVNLLRTYLLLPGHFMVNGVSWSLTNELFFYLIFTIALFIPNKKYSLILFIGSFVGLIVAAILVTSNSTDNTWFNIFTNPMNMEFLLGILIVLVLDKISTTAVYPILITGIVWFAIAAFLTDKGIIVIGIKYNPALNRVILFGLPSFLIIAGLVKMEVTQKINVKNVFLKLGDASYSIYLIHLPIVAAFYKLLPKFNITNQIIVILLSVVLFIAVCKAGMIIFDKIEKPLIKKLNRWWFANR